MVQINEVTPSRFRVGDLITISGFGFSPTFGNNEVAIDGIPEPIQNESDTELQVLVPAGVTEDAYVPVSVFRTDSFGNDSFQSWSKADLDDLCGGVVRVPGQVPGEAEADDASRVEDVPQAQDYQRLLTAIEHLLFDILFAAGDVFAFDGMDLVPQAIGSAGQRLGANPATSTGMEYAAIARSQTLQWAGRKLAATVALGEIVANGETSDTSVASGSHLAPITGNLRSVIVLFSEGSAGDTLDQVRVKVNGVSQYDSGTGLGIVPGDNHSASFTIAVTGGTDTIEVEVKKAGTAGDGNFFGHVEVR